ncbi:hypothetical protein LOD99_3842 [Oopsacas minuta]|uniref:Uncharacterized protein n=1 Tax=Oopsacas minuta TaxID=111878 RepID=A0AAV7JX82_9METZ|nr:hypothetical protein LOD99_3842 [Oopsacas minuta]
MVVAAPTQKPQVAGQDSQRQQPLILPQPMYQSGQGGSQTILMASQSGGSGYYLAHPQQVAGGQTIILHQPQGTQQKSGSQIIIGTSKPSQTTANIQPQVVVTSGTQSATQIVVQAKPPGNVAQVAQATPQTVRMVVQQPTPATSTIHID